MLDACAAQYANLAFRIEECDVDRRFQRAQRRLVLGVEVATILHRDDGCASDALDTRAGELKLVPEPTGTRGYDDLRRRADGEPLGRGLRPQVASADDLARMLGALDRDQDIERLLRLRRLMNLEHQLSRELGRGRGIER